MLLEAQTTGALSEGIFADAGEAGGNRYLRKRDAVKEGSGEADGQRDLLASVRGRKERDVYV